jgi:hypothetical protein
MRASLVVITWNEQYVHAAFSDAYVQELKVIHVRLFSVARYTTQDLMLANHPLPDVAYAVLSIIHVYAYLSCVPCLEEKKLLHMKGSGTPREKPPASSTRSRFTVSRWTTEPSPSCRSEQPIASAC